MELDPATLQTVLTLGTIFGLYKGGEAIVKKKRNGSGNGAVMDRVEHDALMKVMSVTSKVDADGTPLVYFPRSAIEVLKEIRDAVVDQNSKLDTLLRRGNRDEN